MKVNQWVAAFAGYTFCPLSLDVGAAGARAIRAVSTVGPAALSKIAQPLRDGGSLAVISKLELAIVLAAFLCEVGNALSGVLEDALAALGDREKEGRGRDSNADCVHYVGRL